MVLAKASSFFGSSLCSCRFMSSPKRVR